jgi:membrane protein implicated in regulation of membrane protease activity
MIEFFNNIITPAMLPYTIPLGIVLAYWLFVICTGLDFGTDALDGAIEGVLDGAVDGAVDGAIDGAGEVMEVADAPGCLGSIVAFLNLGKVPSTIVFSLIIFKAWIFAYFYHIVLKPSLGVMAIPAFVITILASIAGFVGAVLLTAYTTRPLRKLFEHKIQHGQQHLIGKVCTIRSSLVSKKSGQAEIIIDSSSILLMVRCAEANSLKKGDEAVVVEYDSQANIYDVRPLI